MWASDLIEMLSKWNKDLLIDNIRLNAWGEIVIEDTSHHFYIYSEGVLEPFAQGPAPSPFHF